MPVEVKQMRLDWLLEPCSEEDQQQRGIKLLQAILQSHEIKYFEIPAVQALIQFYYQQLVKWQFHPLRFFLLLLDLF